jgi:hypothetical protein
MNASASANRKSEITGTSEVLRSCDSITAVMPWPPAVARVAAVPSGCSTARWYKSRQ